MGSIGSLLGRLSFTEEVVPMLVWQCADGVERTFDDMLGKWMGLAIEVDQIGGDPPMVNARLVDTSNNREIVARVTCLEQQLDEEMDSAPVWFDEDGQPIDPNVRIELTDEPAGNDEGAES